jgi:hypothetical protein
VPVAETGYLDKRGSFAEEGIAEKNGVSVALHDQRPCTTKVLW